MKPRRVKISQQGAPPSAERIEAQSTPRVEAVERALPEGVESFDTDANRDSWLRRSLLIATVALVATYVLTAIALDLLVDSARVRAWVEPRVSAALNRSVTVGEARIDLFPRPSLRLADVTVANPSGFEGPALASLDEARFDVSWLQLVLGRAVVRRVHLEGPRVRLAISENGVSNFGDLAPTRRGEGSAATAAPFAAALRRVTMAHGSLSFFDASRDRSFMVTEGGGRADIASGTNGEWLADVTIASDSLLVRLPSLTEEIVRSSGPTTRILVTGESPLRAIGLDDGVLVLAGDTLLVRGRIDGLDSERPSFDVQLTNDKLSTRALMAVIPEERRSSLLPHVEGTMALTVQIQGGLTTADHPVVHGVARFDDVILRFGGDVVADAVDGLVRFDSAQVQIQAMTGLFAGGPFEIAGSVSRDGRRSTELAARGRADLDALDRVGLLPDALTLSGSAGFDLALSGSLLSVDSLDAVGTLTLDGVQVEHERLGAPLYVPGGVVTLDRREVRWADLGILVGAHALTTSGEIEDPAAFRTVDAGVPGVRLAVTGGHLDLDALFPPRHDTPATYPQLAFAHLGGRSLDGRVARAVAQAAALSRPEHPAVTGTILIDVDTVAYRRYRLEGVSTALTLTDSTLSMTEAAFSVWGGEGHVSLELGFGDEWAQSFALSLRLRDVSASPFLSNLTPAGDAIAGRLDADIDLTGFLDELLLPVADSLSGHARVDMSEGHLAGTGVNAALADFLEAEEWTALPFDTWTTELGLRGDLAQVEHSDLRGPFGRIVFGGAFGLDGDADVSVALSLPSDQLGVVSLRRTGIGSGVVAQLRESGRALDLGLRLSGPLGAPSLEPDADNAVALARR